LADEYRVRVKMNCGPFAIDEKFESLISPKKAIEMQMGRMQ
jgi:hypothetical protein